MNPEIPVEILSLHPKLRVPLKFGSDSDQFYAERSDSKKRFPITEWQLELLIGMDGEQSFGSLIEEWEFGSNTKVDATSMSSFYTWLYDEELITTVTRTPAALESVFEIVIDEEEPDKAESIFAKISRKISQFPGLPFNRWDPVLKAACYAVTVLGVIRIAWVVAPAFEPALQRANADIADYFRAKEVDEPVSVAESSHQTAERIVQPTQNKALNLAGRIRQIDTLREQLAACRIRRDEYYLQNNEDGYRVEVEEITRLTRKIGELELAD